MGAKQKIVVISFYQTPVKPPKPPPHSSPPPSTRLPRPKTRGFDRRALLLAYGRQLRRVHATGDEDRMAASPNWRKWKDEFAAQNTIIHWEQPGPDRTHWVVQIIPESTGE
ncbi:hypothetical protein KSP39_PZI016965 [Platanthera zijinensis]|uniref:Uncharacterized protein n=1 Tax=Platanthera zijinensis TaxID=2320716 RepID=A0AAP0B7G5_9ASPA